MRERVRPLCRAFQGSRTIQVKKSPRPVERGMTFLVVVSVAALAIRMLVVSLAPPGSDVYYFLKEAVQAIFSGQNPYTYDYTGVPASLLTPGTSHLFAYLPVSFLYLVPFYLSGDIRVGFVVADLVVGCAIFFYAGRWRKEAVLVFLLAPFTVLFSTVYLNAALLAMPFMALFFLLESRGRSTAASICYGVALAATQFTVLTLPFVVVYYAGRRRVIEPLLSSLVACAVIAPFLAASPVAFFDDTLVFQFQRAISPLFVAGGAFGFALNPSLDGFLAWATGEGAPLYLKLLVEAVALALLIRVRDLPSLARSSALFLTLSAFVLPNDFFWAYLELPFMLTLFWLATPGGVAPMEEPSIPKT